MVIYYANVMVLIEDKPNAMNDKPNVMNDKPNYVMNDKPNGGRKG